eukprot:scaffold846_cov252-Pinguiococcus_pyrenoidosus.AAC.43
MLYDFYARVRKPLRAKNPIPSIVDVSESLNVREPDLAMHDLRRIQQSSPDKVRLLDRSEADRSAVYCGDHGAHRRGMGVPGIHPGATVLREDHQPLHVLALDARGMHGHHLP